MLSGDNESTCKLISEKLNIKEYYSELLPQDKLSILEKKLSNNTKSKTAFVGDGINDAPALSRSDIGISMGSLGSDAAIEASDIVIIDDDIRKISEVIKISKKTYSIVKQNIFFSIAIKVLIMILCIFGYTNMALAIFGDVGVSLLAILNSSKLLMKKNKVVKK
jgi:Cd2+/Zn2+-exporting ATPase